jgi:hypothetical protein
MITVHSSNEELKVFTNTLLREVSNDVCFVNDVYWLDKLPNNWAGSYRSSGKVIKLARCFFQNLPEAEQQREIRAVLYHELAHHLQYWMEPYCEVPHGKAFRHAMHWINSKLREDIVQPYHHLRKTIAGREADSIKRKALSLLALTESSNEHEAAVAAAKYSQLCARYDFELDTESAALAESLPEVVEECFFVSKQAAQWMRDLFATVVYVHAGSLFWRTSQATACQWFCVARTTKVAQIYELATYLTEAVERTVAKHRSESRHRALGRSYWNAFRQGVVSTVRKSLLDDLKRRHSDGIPAGETAHIPGLVIRSAFDKEREEVQSFMDAKVGKVRTAKSNRSRDGYAMLDGMRAGDAISIARQVERSAPTRALCGA